MNQFPKHEARDHSTLNIFLPHLLKSLDLLVPHQHALSLHYKINATIDLPFSVKMAIFKFLLCAVVLTTCCFVSSLCDFTTVGITFKIWLGKTNQNLGIKFFRITVLVFTFRVFFWYPSSQTTINMYDYLPSDSRGMSLAESYGLRSMA